MPHSKGHTANKRGVRLTKGTKGGVKANKKGFTNIGSIKKYKSFGFSFWYYVFVSYEYKT